MLLDERVGDVAKLEIGDLGVQHLAIKEVSATVRVVDQPLFVSSHVLNLQRILVHRLLFLILAFALVRAALRDSRLRTDVVNVAKDDVLVAVV